jgi:formylglycine-generating enzyme required for sulfatase activity
MVRLPEGYCIDSTEVTRAQYRAWLDTTPSAAGQISACTGNSTFTPDASCMARPEVCQTGCENHPQVCVDWCDAYAYCQAVGKRLCGKIGGGPIEEGPYTWIDASVSQWYSACSAHGTQMYACGETYEPGTCNGSENDAYRTVPVGTLSGCQSPVSGYGGIYDLSGNVMEWEDSCNDRGCRVRGGDFATGNSLSCAVETFTYSDSIADSRHVADWYTGFRCCSSP